MSSRAVLEHVVIPAVDKSGNVNIDTTAQIYVYKTDGTTLWDQAIYAADSGGSPLSQPLSVDTKGTLIAYTPLAGRCTLKINGVSYPSEFRVPPSRIESSSGGFKVEVDATTGTKTTGNHHISGPLPHADLRAYGTVGNGENADAAMAAANAAVPNGGTIEVPYGNYTFTQGWDLTNRSNITIKGMGREATILSFATSGHPCIDMTGAGQCKLEDLIVQGSASNTPNVGILLARSTAGGSGANHRFHNVDINGKFTVAAVYDYGAESNTYEGCLWAPETDAAWAYYHTATNTAQITSVYTTISEFLGIGQPGAATNGWRIQSTGNVTFFGGALNNFAATAVQGEAVRIDGGGGVRFFGTYFSGGGGRVIRLSGQLFLLEFNGIIVEPTSAGLPTYSIEHDGGSGDFVSGLACINASFNCAASGAGVRGNAGVLFRGLYAVGSGSVDNSGGGANVYLVDVDTLTQSEVHLGAVLSGNPNKARVRTTAQADLFIGGLDRSYVSVPVSAINVQHIPQTGQMRLQGYNMAGTITIAHGSTSGAVAFPVNESDGSYYISLATSPSGSAASGSLRASYSSKSASGFTVNLEADPGGTASVVVDWRITR